jgi:hypothetical protein
MRITIDIPDAQWDEFTTWSQDTVQTKWNGDFGEFAAYIMRANFENYIEAQKRRQGYT